MKKSCLLLLFSAVAACSENTREGVCHCPAILVGTSVIQLPCGTAEPPEVKIVSGACTIITPATKQTVEVLSGGNAGVCRVALTFSGGAKSSVDVSFTLGPWMSCDSDPHGCGRSTFAEQPEMQIGDQCADAGMSSDASK